MDAKQLTSEQEYGDLLKLSRETPVYLLKHSLTCPVSSAAYRQFDVFLRENKEVPGYVLKIQENRGLSNYVAQESGIVHQSPQVLVYKDEKVIWDESHYSISLRSLTRALTE